MMAITKPKHMLCGSSVEWGEWKPYEKWASEPKIDGIRAIVVKNGQNVTLIGRAGKLQAGRFPEFGLAGCPDFAADAEISHRSFRYVNRRNKLEREPEIERSIAEDGPCTLALFDLLYFRGRDIRHESYAERKKMLGDFRQSRTLVVVPVIPAGELEEDVETDQEVMINGIPLKVDGVVFKNTNSAYRGGRSLNWVKSKLRETSDFLLTGLKEYPRRKKGKCALILEKDGDTVALDMEWKKDQFYLLRELLSLARKEGVEMVRQLQIYIRVSYFPDKEYANEYREPYFKGMSVGGKYFKGLVPFRP